MRDYNRNSRSSGGRYGGGGGGFRGRDSGRREMHKAVCDECGKNCEVPFRPSGDKPIFCSDCFERKDGGSSRRPSRRVSGGPGLADRDNTNKQLLEQVSSMNAKLERIIQVLESRDDAKPVSKKPEVKKEVKKAVKKVASKEKSKTKKASKKEAKKSPPKD